MSMADWYRHCQRTNEQAATQIYGGKPMTGDWKPDARTVRMVADHVALKLDRPDIATLVKLKFLPDTAKALVEEYLGAVPTPETADDEIVHFARWLFENERLKS